MPKAFPKEFRNDVVAVARRGEAPISRIAKDFGVSESCLQRWLKIADVEDGIKPGVTQADAAELREAKKRIRLLEQENEILRRAAAYLSQASPPQMMFPLVLDLAADRIPIAVACRMLGFSKQAFFRWRANPVSQRDWDNAHLTNAAVDLHRDDPAFGYRFISDEIEAESGLRASERRVWRLCSEQRLWSVFSKKRGLNPKAGPPVHDDLVLRDFTATRPDQLWLTDITEHWTDEGKLYLCAIKDIHSNRIVGYSLDSRMTADLAVAALRNAIALRDPVGTTLHSDRGSQFRSRKFVELLRETGITGSMGRVGACADNAAMESFFSLLQKNVLNKRRWHSRQELRLEIVTWIERTYHRRRRQRRLGRLTPIEFEIINSKAAHAA
ncbi:IS3 family transposase [Microbacterium sp. KKR3/1]|uniref:IS3 family transposase n=1 Tax=Microbacterium sp. KKR3/1 TaxID=2904241 RepID=UPI001E2BDBC9|nr:IS3 family transposase [Microbacterium sp. KKR3/1]MCE0510385.1 IS3 family transposase [Microbacterium sp. KKR3/1]